MGVRQLFISIFMGIVKTVVTIYTIVSFPIYLLHNKPWKVVKRSNRMRSRHENPKDLSSPFIRNENENHHPLTECETFVEAVQKTIQLHGSDRIILGHRDVLSEEPQLDHKGNVRKVDGRVLNKYALSEYKWLNYGQVMAEIDVLCKGLLFYNVKPRQNVLIFSETRIEWFLFANAVSRIGAVIVTLFANLGDDGIVHGINETESTFIITTYDLTEKLKSLLSKTPKVNTIVYIEGVNPFRCDGIPSHVKLISMSQLKSDGSKEENHNLKGCEPKSDDIAVIMYTSGTTGEPKGVVITHKAIVASGKAILSEVISLINDAPKHVYISYLPLAHIFEFSVQMFLFLGGVRIGYATPFTLSDSSPGLASGITCDIKLLRPTAMISVPLVLDRVRKEIYNKLKARTPVSCDLFNYLMCYKTFWTSKGFQTPITNQLLCSKVRQQLGGNLQILITGGAPISANNQALIKAALNVTLVQGYGTTETSGPAVAMDFDDLSYGRIGCPLFGAKIKLIDWDEGGYRVTDVPNPRGEIVIGGDIICNGYFKRDAETKDAFSVDADGCRWFYSGDIGEMFPDGTFQIIDRRKDLVKLQNGEYISLGKIETVLKCCEYVENICAIGGVFSNYLIAIVVPNKKSLDQLAAEKGKGHLSHEELCDDKTINQIVYSSIVDTATLCKLRKIEIPQLIKLVPQEWGPDNDMLTAAMKLKRRNVMSFYRNEIDHLLNTIGNGNGDANVKQFNNNITK